MIDIPEVQYALLVRDPKEHWSIIREAYKNEELSHAEFLLLTGFTERSKKDDARALALLEDLGIIMRIEKN